jgi:uncharacterized repeat protein (TIGR04052 family)
VGWGVPLRCLAALLLLTACPAGQVVELRFEARVDGAALRCGAPARLADGRRVDLADLRFYVHDVALEDVHGARVPVRLADAANQAGDVALVDLADGRGTCRDSDAAVHATIRGSVAAGEYRRLHLRVGVPFAANHADPILARGPLSALSMHWGWQGGYKFVRADLRVDGFSHAIHLGSTRCRGEIGAVERCDRPNLAAVDVAIAGLAPIVALELAPLLAPVADDPVPGCMAEADDPGCQPVFSAMGLDPATGAAHRASAVFRPR